MNPFSRRGVTTYGSGRFNTSPRLRKQTNFLSFRSTRRQTPRPNRAKEVLERLITSLDDGIAELKVYCEQKKKELPSSVQGVEGTKMMTYYMDQEKMVKSLERRIRTLEVHKDKVEEMRDEYELKLKLREGAFNLASALATQSGKASKEKLAAARAEQKDLLEDLCDIEDELDTKLGVFRVSIEGIVGPTKLNNGDNYELQLKLANQKWKARCRVEKHHQLWQDNEIMFIGRITDELSIKLVEVKKIQADSSIGSAKWRTREMLSFCPQEVKVVFQTHSGALHLCLKVRWSPTIEDDFLSELNLPTVELVVGGSRKRSRKSSHGHQKLNGDSSTANHRGSNSGGGGGSTTTDGGKVSTGTMGSRSSSLLSVRRAVELEEDHRKWAEEQSRAYKKNSEAGLIQRSLEDSLQGSSPRHNHLSDSKINGSHLANAESTNVEKGGANRHLPHPVIRKHVSTSVIPEEGHAHFRTSPSSTAQHRKSMGPLPSASKSSPPTELANNKEHREESYPGSVGKRMSYEAAISLSSTPSNECPDTLASAIEAVNLSLEEPKVVYADLRALEFQLLRLEGCLRGSKLHRSGSMTLSESVALDSFSFLTIDDQGLRGEKSASQPSSLEGGVSGSDVGVSSLTRDHRTSRDHSVESTEGGVRERVSTPEQPGPLMEGGRMTGSGTEDSAFCSEVDEAKLSALSTTGVEAIDRALTQHLIYCDHLLQDLLQLSLSASSPLNHKLKQNLTKLRKEAEIIKDLLNMAVDLYCPPNLEEVLPELASNKELFSFWKEAASSENLLCISCDSFLVALDQKWGSSIWTNFPDVANKVFLVLLSRILDLENESGDLADTKMVVTVFQFSSYFFQEIQHGDMEAHISVLAAELQFTEGASSPDHQIRIKTAQAIAQAVFNKGAILAVAMLLKEDNLSIKAFCVAYLDKLMMTPAWHRDAISYCLGLLEHTDQAVRRGTCYALGRLRAVESAPHLKFMTKVDFPEIQAAAHRALSTLGYGPNPMKTSGSTHGNSSSSNGGGGSGGKKKKNGTAKSRTKELLADELPPTAASMRSKSAPATPRQRSARSSAPVLAMGSAGHHQDYSSLHTTHV